MSFLDGRLVLSSKRFTERVDSAEKPVVMRKTKTEHNDRRVEREVKESSTAMGAAHTSRRISSKRVHFVDGIPRYGDQVVKDGDEYELESDESCG